MAEKTKQTTVPNVFIKGKHVGGHDDTIKAFNAGQFNDMLSKQANKASFSGLEGHALRRKYVGKFKRLQKPLQVDPRSR